MTQSLGQAASAAALPIYLVSAAELADWLQGQSGSAGRWVQASGFQAKHGAYCLLPGADGSLAGVLVGCDPGTDPFVLGGLARELPGGEYRLAVNAASRRLADLCVGWALGAYRFERFKPADRAPAVLALPREVDQAALRREVAAVSLTRDLINTPAEQMGPTALAEAAAALAEACGAEFRQVVGEDLLSQGYPLIHAVGRASRDAPRLLELCWGDAAAPLLALVGKGVCFDSGGLDLKPASAMRLMKKDMGGAAHVLGLAQWIMQAGLPVRLRVLVPAVENAVSGNALRPGDVIVSRKGLAVEIDNTDAEGRLVLADALADADAQKPALMLDFATLTGAARVALGTEIPALFSNRDDLAEGLLAAGRERCDPLWRLPLHAPYRELLDSKIADLANSTSGGYGGAITAALFLAEFVSDETDWAHVDVMAWNNRARPGRPEGGEAMGLRATFAYLSRRFPG